MAGEFTKPTALVAAQVGQLAKSDDYNKNLALIAKDSFIPVDVDGSPADGDLGDETIGTNGTLIEDLKVRTGKALKVYDAGGVLSETIAWTALTGLERYTIKSFADLSSGSYTTGDYHIATVTTGIFTKDYIYLKITTGSGRSEIVPYDGQNIFLETNSAMYFYNTVLWEASTRKILIEEVVASSVASVIFATGIDSTYESYAIEITNMQPATDSVEARMEVSEDGGSTWKTGATDYNWVFEGRDSGNSGLGGGSSNDTHIKLSDFSAVVKIGNYTNSAYNAEIKLFNPSSASIYKSFKGSVTYRTSNASVIFASLNTGGLYKGTANAINAIKIYMSSGNISVGTFRLYGLI